MELRKIGFWDLTSEICKIKPGLIDTSAHYVAAFDGKRIIGIVGWQIHRSYIYCCHDFVVEEFRDNRIYERLFNCRLHILKAYKLPIVAHCTDSSLKMFKKNGFNEDCTLTKVILDILVE